MFDFFQIINQVGFVAPRTCSNIPSLMRRRIALSPPKVLDHTKATCWRRGWGRYVDHELGNFSVFSWCDKICNLWSKSSDLFSCYSSSHLFSYSKSIVPHVCYTVHVHRTLPVTSFNVVLLSPLMLPLSFQFLGVELFRMYLQGLKLKLSFRMSQVNISGTELSVHLAQM